MTAPRYCLDSSGSSVIDLEKRCFIPFSRDNSDFQRVLSWIAEGNVLGPFTQEALDELNRDKPLEGQRSSSSLDDLFAPPPTTPIDLPERVYDPDQNKVV